MDEKEKNPLLSKNTNYIDSYKKTSSTESSSDTENWSDGSSSSYYSDSDSYIPEWDSLVQDDGELVYIVSKTKNDNTSEPKVDSSGLLSKVNERNSGIERNGFTRQSVRRSSKGKWLKILKRRNSARSFAKDDKTLTLKQNIDNIKKSNLINAEPIVTSKVTFNENEEGELKEFSIEVDFSNRLRFGRRNNQVESLFGISVNTFEDGKRLMVSGILPDTQAANQKQIKIGDWLKQIDNKSVNSENIDQILNEYSDGQIQVKLVLQRVAGAEVACESPANIVMPSDTIKHLTEDVNEHDTVLMQILRDLPVAVIYLKTEGLSENGPENDGVLYCYPRPEKCNFLCSCRGTFITLNHLIPDVLKNTKPTSCTIIAKECLVNVVYTLENTDLLLLAIPENKCNLFELTHVNAEIVRVLEFCYKSLNSCFTNASNVKKLDSLFSRLFTQIMTCGYGWDSQKSVRIEDIISSSESQADPMFEQCLPIVQTVHLPWEAQLQIDDALTELDATYISRSNHDVDAQDIFHIMGTCLYYAGHLLVSHLIQENLVEINSFLRMQGFLSISYEEDLQNLIVWKEVYFNNETPAKYEDDPQDGAKPYNVQLLSNYRTYIIIIGKGHLMLVTLLRGTQDSKNVPPSPYFVEECESTVDLLIDVGLDKFLQQWFHSNLQPQIILQPEDFISSPKAKENAGSFVPFNKKASPVSKKSPEIQSILKKRLSSSDQINNSSVIASSESQLNSSQSQLSVSGIGGQWGKGQQPNSSNANPYVESEDSESQNSNSEINEERIQGRKAAREKENRTGRNSVSSDSCTEWDGCEGTSQFSGSYELGDLSQSLLQKMGILLPTKITAGDNNMCFHFVRLESELGVLLAPTLNVQKQSDSELYRYILTNFRKSSQKIHTLLQNTIRFKKMLSPSSSVNKSLVAIKEHGILFEIPSKFHQNSKKNEDSFSYWVIGRLFEYPKFAEVYVCCHESVPQNMVDIAFRLAFVS
ncbi:inturned planar cell polarity protein [Arctopsyche grandis]|uniref:inturned planar cell polarity protein n=1 Tax=Arctopsyche grandis TaxID=121162 RepID=UPI00406D7DCB